MSRLAPEEIERLAAQLPLRGALHTDLIELEAAQQFAAAIGAVLHSNSAGRLVAPTTILTRLMITDRPPWYEDLLRGTMFHAGERYLMHQEIVVGSELEWTGTLEAITSKTLGTSVVRAVALRVSRGRQPCRRGGCMEDTGGGHRPGPACVLLILRMMNVNNPATHGR